MDELNGTELTAEQFEAIYHKYTEVVEILVDTFYLSPMRNRRILPEIPADSQRKLAVANLLDQDRMKYAKLIDINEDGIEDLLTAQAVSIPTPDG